MLLRLITAIVFFGGFISLPAAQNAPAGAKFVTEVEGLREYRLDNGLQVLLFPDASKPTTTVNITYRVGSRHENYGETGMAHLLEHMLFKGTPTRPFLWKEMADRGFNNNGTTWLDRTNYYESFTAKEESLKWAIDMEADRMINSKIDKSDLDTEMTVVRNEFESGENSPFQVLLKRMGSVAYDWHSYGKSTIGNRSDIENVGIDNLRAFYKKYYQPDNATLLIGGKFDPDKTLKMIVDAFGPIAKPTRVLPTLWTVEPAQDGERTFTVRRSGDVQIILAGFKVPPGIHPDYAAISVLSSVLGDDASGRLKKSLVDSTLAVQAFSFGYPTFDPGLIFAGAVLRGNQDLQKANDALMTELSNIAEITPAEVTRAQNAFIKGTEETLRAPDRLSIALSESIAQGDWRLFFFQRDQVKKVTAADVTRVAKTYFKRDNRTVGTFIPTTTPDRAPAATRPDLVAMLKDYKGDASVKTGEVFDPTPANLDARSQRFALANGMQVALLPKSTRGEAVNVSIRLRAGSLESLKGQSGASSLASGMLMRGTSQLTREQIKDKFDAMKATVGLDTSGGSISTTRPNLIESIKLAALVLKDASFPADEFAKLKQETITGIEFGKKDPQTVATDKLQEHMRRYPLDDPRTRATSQESLMMVEAATRDAALDYYKRFVGGAGGQIAIVGDFDANEVKALLEKEFGSWKAAVPYTRIPDESAPAKPADFVVNTPDKENAMFLAAQPLNVNDDHPDNAGLILANYIYGANPGSRLFSRVREKEGLSYGVGSQLNVPTFERGGSMILYAIAAPANMEKVLASIKDETAKIMKEGFSADEVAKAKTAWLQERQAGRASDRNVAGTWAGLMHANRTFAFSQKYDDAVANVTAEQVNATFRTHIDLTKMTFVRALDQSKLK
jgi:zinc protease